METGSSGKWRISVCGLNCADCDIHSAGHGNEKMRDEIIEWFRKERNETLKPEQIRCEGCIGPLDVHWSPQCKMMLCAKKRGLQHCFNAKNSHAQALTNSAQTVYLITRGPSRNRRGWKKSGSKRGLRSRGGKTTPNSVHKNSFSPLRYTWKHVLRICSGTHYVQAR